MKTAIQHNAEQCGHSDFKPTPVMDLGDLIKFQKSRIKSLESALLSLIRGCETFDKRDVPTPCGTCRACMQNKVILEAVKI